MATRNDVDLFCDVCTEERGIDLQALEETIHLAVGIAREGRDGRETGCHGLHIKGPYSTRASEQITIASKKGTAQERQ